MEDQIKQWIAKGYALEVALVILDNDKEGDLDQETLILEITNAALENMQGQLVMEANPMLTEEQVSAVVDSAAKSQLRNTISEMVEAGLLEAELNEEGEVVYKTTAKGCAYDDMIQDGFMTQEDFNKQFKEGKI
jgi:excinuclease UvrABC helicase subunit UvrB